MKSKILTFIALCFAKMLFAQDSVRVETVIDTAFTPPQYVGAFDDAFLTHQETKWLLKFDPIAWAIQFNSNNGKLQTEYERKLNESFSLNTALFFNLSYSGSIIAQSRNISNSKGFGFSIEPRWYYQMSKKIKENQSANNLNGNYFGLKIGAEIIPKGWGSTFLGYKVDTSFNGHITFEQGKKNDKALTSYQFEVNYGIQRRLFRHSYVNFSFGLGIAREQSVRIDDPANRAISYKTFWHPFLNNRVSFGFAFGDKKDAKTTIAACDLFRCFEEENNFLKIDLLGFVQNIDVRNVAARTAVSYEFWLLSSKNISLNSTIFVNGKYYNPPRSELNAWSKNPIKSFEMRGTLEPRYYYSLKKNIALGKSAHSFSGGYIGFPFSLAFQNDNHLSNIYDNIVRPTVKRQIFSIAGVMGIQKRLFKNGYFDLSAGWAFENIKSSIKYFNESGPSMLIRGELGLAF